MCVFSIVYKLYMPVSFHRGPLDATLAPGPGIRFCAPDGHIPWQASGLRFFPNIQPIAECNVLYYLEGHRAPDSVLAELEKLKCKVVVQGDPLSVRPPSCNLIASKLILEPEPPWVCPPMTYFATLEECVQHMVGNGCILAGNRENAKAVAKHLRGGSDNVIAGDSVYDWKTQRRARVLKPAKVVVGKGRTAVYLDDGRVVHSCDLNSRVVDTPHTLGHGEFDSLVVLPDVPDVLGKPALRRIKHLVIGVGWHPIMYCST